MRPTPSTLCEPERALVPAAQYIRMSTDGQDISLAIQRTMICRYAESHGIRIVATYEDSGRSGLTIRGRPAMRRLIQDVATDSCQFQVVLVYDVSRWGRFRDTDESAYYEYHCRLHGVQVHYVGEPFSPELTLASALLKNIKRAMAAEYSRELSVKVRAGQSRVIEMGYQMGTPPCLGFRRVAVSADGVRKRILEWGERKPAPTDRVRWVLGPQPEVELVRTIFNLYAKTKLSIHKIVRLLNDEGHVTSRGKRFNFNAIYYLIQCEAFIGNFVWGRLAHGAACQRRADTDPAFSRKMAVLPIIIDDATWQQAKRKREDRYGCRLSDDEVIQNLRKALLMRPDLKPRELLDLGCQSATTYRKRFGSLRAAIALALGQRVSPQLQGPPTRKVTQHFINDLVTLLRQEGVAATKPARQSALVLENRVRIAVQLLWRKDTLGPPRWELRKRLFGGCNYILLLRMQDSQSAADFVMLTESEYWESHWLMSVAPSRGIGCSTAAQLVAALRACVVDC